MRFSRLSLRVGAFVALVLCTHVACTIDLDGYAGDPAATDASDGADAGIPDTYVPDVDAADPDAVYGALIEADQPVAFFRFDDKPGAGAAIDSVGGHDALCSKTGVTFGSSGFRGGAVDLDGTGYLDLGDVFEFSGLVPFTLEGWMRPKNGTFGGRLFYKRDESDPNNFKGYVFYLAGQDRSVHFEGWGASLSAWTNGAIDAPLSATGFTYVAVVVSYSGGVGNAAVYIDGRKSGIGGFDNTTPLPATAVDLLLGQAFVGTLDELALYDHALTPAQIDVHFTAGRQ